MTSFLLKPLNTSQCLFPPHALPLHLTPLPPTFRRHSFLRTRMVELTLSFFAYLFRLSLFLSTFPKCYFFQNFPLSPFLFKKNTYFFLFLYCWGNSSTSIGLFVFLGFPEQLSGPPADLHNAYSLDVLHSISPAALLPQASLCSVHVTASLPNS